MTMSLRLIDESRTDLIPRIATLKSAAADLRAAIDEPIEIPKLQGARIPTGITARFSEGHCGLMIPRSGIAGEPHFITITNAPGLIDTDYTGELFVNFFVLGKKFTINPGDRIAQIICIERAKITGHINHCQDVRGDKGLGSSGAK